jgi:hypothetical protein
MKRVDDFAAAAARKASTIDATMRQATLILMVVKGSGRGKKGIES